MTIRNSGALRLQAVSVRSNQNRMHVQKALMEYLLLGRIG